MLNLNPLHLKRFKLKLLTEVFLIFSSSNKQVWKLIPSWSIVTVWSAHTHYLHACIRWLVEAPDEVYRGKSTWSTINSYPGVGFHSKDSLRNHSEVFPAISCLSPLQFCCGDWLEGWKEQKWVPQSYQALPQCIILMSDMHVLWWHLWVLAVSEYISMHLMGDE